MASEKMVNYSAEQVADMSAKYLAGVSVEALAVEMGKSVRSVVAKLSQLGVYVKASKAKAASKATKADLVKGVAEMLGLEAGKLESLEKADKAALEALFGAVYATNGSED